MDNSNIQQIDVYERFAKIVMDSLHIDRDKITPDAMLIDLGAESLDVVEIAIHAEEAFNISLPEKNILQTAIEVCGPGVLENNGVLTDLAKQLLRDRMPEIDPAVLQGDVTVKSIATSFQRVGTWVRMIQDFMEFTPKVCPQCGEALQTSIALRMKCGQCGTETPISSGEELNKRWVEQYCDRLQIPLIKIPLETSAVVGNSTTPQSA